MANKINIEIWNGTPFPSKTHMVTLDETGKYATLVCSGKLLNYQGLNAGVGFEDLTCIKCKNTYLGDKDKFALVSGDEQ